MKLYITVIIFLISLSSFSMDAEHYALAKAYTEKEYLKPAQEEAIEAEKNIKTLQEQETQSEEDKKKIEELEKVIKVHKLWQEYIDCLGTLEKGSNEVSKLRGMKVPLVTIPRRYKKLTQKKFPRIIGKFKDAYYKKKEKEQKAKEGQK